MKVTTSSSITGRHGTCTDVGDLVADGDQPLHVPPGNYGAGMQEEITGGRISFVTQRAPIDERGRAMYAVSRSILRALIDQLSTKDLTVLNTDKTDVTLRQLSMMARLQRDKGMRGDGFEWAVHEALRGGEQSVVEPVAEAMKRMSKRSFASTSHPRSILFGYERAKYLGGAIR